jgi:hypothetical protein
MRSRAEEEPDEPDEPEEPEPAAQSGSGPMLPTVAPGGREFEYKVDVVSVEQVTDGKTLPERLGKASADGWDLYEVIDAGDRRALLLRRPKKNDREARRVGFAPPGT